MDLLVSEENYLEGKNQRKRKEGKGKSGGICQFAMSTSMDYNNVLICVEIDKQFILFHFIAQMKEKSNTVLTQLDNNN